MIHGNSLLDHILHRKIYIFNVIIKNHTGYALKNICENKNI